MSASNPRTDPTSGADSPKRMQAKALAAARREEMARRTQRIRRSVAALASTFFVLAFLAIYVQLATGHDPALTASAARRSASADVLASTSSAASGTEATGSSTESSGSSTESTGETTSSSAGESSSSSSSTETPSSVTTSQS
jgi:hypothetical protein